MKTRLCPYCDSVMKKKHRCDMCNSFVLKANVIDVHFNASGSDDRLESCAYDMRHEPLKNGAQISNYKPSVNNKTSNFSKTKEWSKQIDLSKINRRPKGKAVSSLIVIIAIIIFNLFQCISESLGVEDFSDRTPETAPLAEAKDAFEPIYYDLEESDLQYYEGCCDNPYHMDIDASMVNEVIASDLGQWGLKNSYSKNFTGYRYASDYYEDVYYEYGYLFSPYDDYNNYIEVWADAITNQVHSIDICLENRDESFIGFELVKHIAEDVLGFKGIDENEYQLLFVDDFDEYAIYCDQYVIYSSYSEYSDWWSVSITIMDYPYGMDAVVIGETELTREDVENIGVQCNTTSHMEGLYGTETTQMLSDWFVEMGFDTMNVETGEYNYHTVYSQTGDSVWNCYNFNRHKYWYSDTIPLRIIVQSDSYSDVLHSVSFEAIPEDDMSIYVSLLLDVLNADIDPVVLAKAAQERLIQYGYGFISIKDYEFYFSEYDDGIMINVTSLH